MNKKELSKVKHIYHIYTSEDNVIHCEKHAVIYINSNIVYYKGARKEQLGSTRIDYIKEKFESHLDLNISTSYYSRVYLNEWFYEVENFNSQEITDIIFKKEKEDKLARAEREFKKAEHDFKAKKEIFEKLKEKY